MRLYISLYYRDTILVLEALFWTVAHIRHPPSSNGIVGIWVKYKGLELSVILTLESKNGF